MPNVVRTALTDPMSTPAERIADPSRAAAPPPHPTDDLVSHALSDGWHALRRSPSRLVAWRLATWLVEGIPWLVWAAVAYSFAGALLVSDAGRGAIPGHGLFDRAALHGLLMAVGLVLWVITHLARGVYTAVALDAQRGERRAIGGWFRRRWPALMGWGVIEAGLVLAVAAVATMLVLWLRPLLDAAWIAAGFTDVAATAPPSTPPSLPWGAAFGLSVFTTLAAAVLITLPVLAIWSTWARLQLVPWRLADDAPGLRAAVADSWRWMPGHRTAWGAMFVGWAAVWTAAVWIPVLGVLAASLLGWSWTAAFYERVRAASLDVPPTAPEAALVAAPATTGHERWPWLDATLVGIAAAWTPVACATVAAIVSGSIFLTRAATLAKTLPHALGLPGVLLACSLPVAAIGSGAILWRSLGRSAVWPGRNGWSRNRVVTALVAVIVGLEVGYAVYVWGGGVAGIFHAAGL